jgi:hypothetical protein
MLSRLPNVHELLASEELLEATCPSGRESSERPEAKPLYLVMFGKDLLPLREDAQKNPSKYRAELLSWLTQHPTLPRNVSKWERTLLLESVLDFSKRTAKKEEPPPPTTKVASEEGVNVEPYEEVPDLSAMEAFWWLK